MNISDDHHTHAVKFELDCEEWKQEFNINGFVVLDNIFENETITKLRAGLHKVYTSQCEMVGGEQNLINISEKGIARSPFSDNKDILTQVLLNKKLLHYVDECLDGPSILYSQVGVISSPNEMLYQRKWHREIQYQHFTSSKPIMVQILVPLCDFTVSNGGTEFLPGTHRIEGCPSREVRKNLMREVNLKMGQAVLMNSMLYHRSGINRSADSRELITTAYARPFVAPQFDHRILLSDDVKKIVMEDDKAKQLLGYQWDITSDFNSWRKKRILDAQ